MEANTRRLFEVLSESLRDEEVKRQMVAKVGSSLRLVVGLRNRLVIDVRDVTAGDAVREGDRKSEVDATLEMSDEAFALVCAGKLSPHHAFMTGRLHVKGNLLRAMKSDPLFKLLRSSTSPQPPAPATATATATATAQTAGDRLKQELPSARL